MLIARGFWSRADRGKGRTTGHSSATVWKGMGTRSWTSSPVAPIPTLLVVAVTGIIWKTVDGSFGRSSNCRVDSCWNQYNTAIEAMLDYPNSFNNLTPNQIKCIPLRTYMSCIRNVSRGCFGNINYHGVKEGVHNKMAQQNCSTRGIIYDPRLHGSPVHPLPKPGSPCGYDGPPVYKHCGLFGDPHLKTFSNEFQTCKVRGAWPLINNKHLTVQVTNDPVGNAGRATATSKLTVVIKRNDECAANRFVTYQAQTDHLPGTFDEGRTHYGQDKTVRLVEKDPGKHVEIYISYIDTTVIVRQIGRYFTFSINMPEKILNETRLPYSASSKLQLCVDGCPAKERFDYQAFLSQKYSKLKSELVGSVTAMSRDDATELCREAGVIDFYFDSCVFDLMTTGDTNFTIAANTAYNDVLRLDPNVDKILEKRQNLSHLQIMVPSEGARTSGSWTGLTLMALIISLYCLGLHGNKLL
ncbi:repulsive guidance molecule A-like [Liolophura sinensis]|uniref:repulsive guidance molecule A-like n=1 Tax=Liolophura sinensis TaxID=3198878 RepID=UPI0031586F2C